MKEVVKIVIFVPETHAGIVREALGKAGAGFVGSYKHTSFSVKVIKAVEEVHPYEEVAIDVYPLVLNLHETTKK